VCALSLDLAWAVRLDGVICFDGDGVPKDPDSGRLGERIVKTENIGSWENNRKGELRIQIQILSTVHVGLTYGIADI